MKRHEIVDKLRMRPLVRSIFNNLEVLNLDGEKRDIASLTEAAVLVPLVERERGLNVLLTKRTDHLHDHAGQISFPGGRKDETDLDAIATALREAEEEIGLKRDHVEIVAELDPYIIGTGFIVTPVVGLIDPKASFSPDPFEVAEIFEVPLSFLLEPDSRQKVSRMMADQLRLFYAFSWQHYYIWGATAGMLVNLIDILTVKRDSE